MALIISIVSASAEADGRILLRWSDGTSSEFSSLQAMRDYAAGLEVKKLARDVAFAVWNAKGAPANGAGIVGKGVNVDLSGATPTITVS